ncbi:E3 ubiquitin-protein ligase At1g63170-like isoform X2 [Impatiens glandulifera]|uniref:E3 ubiquitin-protein ligase At1g63170-like isoform X2 n=1 Tax=Impatiens glandulifera TaxID=253017 RepID=UPI001FB11F59|nr:E3 ubiquitin-protein ligase At1g63170-like isoform X2 [Impatiens glandulifera]
MSVSNQEERRENPTDWYPLLLEQKETGGNHEHVINIGKGCDASTSSSPRSATSQGLNLNQHEDGSSNNALVQNNLVSPTLNESISRSSSLSRRGNGSGRRHWSPFNTLMWLSIELVFTLSQITAAIVVLSISGDENPQAPLFAWILGYAVGCAASLPILCWRYLHRNHQFEQAAAPQRQASPRGSPGPESNSYITISLSRNSEDEDGQNLSSGAWANQGTRATDDRFIAIMDHFKMALDCFFAVWFVVGNVWIFGGNSSSAEAPNLYRLCIVFLTISCIGYAMPFILCSMICCCLPCIISMLGVRDDMNGMRGASEETINALPTHNFKSKDKGSSVSSRDSTSSVDEGGLLAAGTEKERAISGEDAVCCICLAKYANNDELRELPCTHIFHTECVDRWLKINASCPLCKFEIHDACTDSAPESGPS